MTQTKNIKYLIYWHRFANSGIIEIENDKYADKIKDDIVTTYKKHSDMFSLVVYNLVDGVKTNYK